MKTAVHAIILLLAARGPLQTADAPQSAIVSGRVIDAATGRPIPGAVVSVAGTAAANPADGVLTNEGGHFVVRGLRKGSLALSAAKAGYVDAAFGQRRVGGSRQMIAVDDGQRLNDLEIRMWRQSAITGTITDDAGDPVIAARVTAFGMRIVAGRRRFGTAGHGTTDDRGVYRIAGLMPGTYIVAVPSTQTSIPTEVMDAFFSRRGSEAQRAELSDEMRRLGAAIAPAGTDFAMAAGSVTVPLPAGTATPTSHPSGATIVYPTLFYPASRVAAQAAPIPLRASEERANVDIQLQPARGTRISGMLVAPEGMASHVGVRLLPVGSEALGEEIETAAAMSDSTGAFTFLGVPSGQYVLSAVRIPRPPPDPDDGPKTIVEAGGARIAVRPPPGPPAPAPIPADATLCALLPLSVGDADVSDVIVPLRPGPRMTGRIEFEGEAAPPSPSSLASIRISLDPADGSPGAKDLSFETGHPDETGQFQTYGVPPGSYVVNVAGLAFPSWVFKATRYQGRDVTDRPIEMTSADVSGVIITLTDKPSTLRGTLRTRGAPDPTAIALAFPVDEEAWSSAGPSPRRMRIGRADVNGTYILPNLPPGDYFVTAVRDDDLSDLSDWFEPRLLRALSRLARRVHLGDREQRRQDLDTVMIDR